jgi:hypothetical protein
MTVRRTIRHTIFLVGIYFLPMLIQGIRDFCQPCPVLNLFQQFQRRKVFDTVRRWIPQRFQQPHTDENRHIRWLAVQHPSRLFRRQAGWQLVQQPQKLMLLLSHSTLNCLGCRWPSKLTPHQVFSFVTYPERFAEEALGHNSKAVRPPTGRRLRLLVEFLCPNEMD